MAKNFEVLFVAVSLDAFDFCIGLSVLAVGLGASAAVAWIPFIGEAAAGAVNLGGGIIGQTIDLSVDASFGTGFILFMWMKGMITAKNIMSLRRTPFIIGKLIPVLDILPLYTGMAVTAILEERAKRAVTANPRLASAALKLALNPEAAPVVVAGEAVRAAREARQAAASASNDNEEGRERALRTPMADIRPRNEDRYAEAPSALAA